VGGLTTEDGRRNRRNQPRRHPERPGRHVPIWLRPAGLFIIGARPWCGGRPPAGVIAGERRQQFVHTDDVARFTAEATFGNGTGAVNITGEGSITMRDIGQMLGRPVKPGVSELAPGEISGLLYTPIVDTGRLRQEWGFSCRWSSRAALRDMARAAHSAVLVHIGEQLDLPGDAVSRAIEASQTATGGIGT
jgi:nucleoside-diphosphate-sugar epimerase